MPVICKKCKVESLASQLTTAVLHAPGGRRHQRDWLIVQFLVAGDAQQHRPEFCRRLFPKYILEASFRVPPQTAGSSQYRAAFFRQFDVTFAPIVGGQSENHQIIPCQGFEVVPQKSIYP